MAYSPFGAGRFPAEGSRPAAKLLAEVARARRAATAHQVALAFLLRDPHVLAIPKAARAAHVEDVAAAVGLTLTDAETARAGGGLPAQGPRVAPDSW